MSFKDDLTSEVIKVLSERWTKRKGRVVPESDDLKLSNDAVTLEGTILYADLDESTNLVDRYIPEFAAEVYKCFLLCSARIIRAEGGEITAYDGDRIMAVFIGDGKNSDAARAALKINGAVVDVINPAIEKQYPKDSYQINHTVGIDTCKLLIARTGIRGANDLVWVGSAANYAAKLSGRSGAPTQITPDVYKKLNDSSKYGTNRQNMWSSENASDIGLDAVYTSTWYWIP